LKDPFSVEGKVTIVTGGGTGIGESIAKEFAKRGAPVLIASRKAENLENVRDEIRRAGGQCELALCDVRDDAHCDAMVAHAVKHFGHLDAISNNHGASITTPSLNLSPNGWRAVVGINLDGVFFCSRAAARRFMAQKSGGSIVNISSTAGVHGSPQMLPYGASKAGAINLTVSHAGEWERMASGSIASPPDPSIRRGGPSCVAESQGQGDGGALARAAPLRRSRGNRVSVHLCGFRCVQLRDRCSADS